jgi:hypothetical protein
MFVSISAWIYAWQSNFWVWLHVYLYVFTYGCIVCMLYMHECTRTQYIHTYARKPAWTETTWTHPYTDRAYSLTYCFRSVLQVPIIQIIFIFRMFITKYTLPKSGSIWICFVCIESFSTHHAHTKKTFSTDFFVFIHSYRYTNNKWKVDAAKVR